MWNIFQAIKIYYDLRSYEHNLPLQHVQRKLCSNGRVPPIFLKACSQFKMYKSLKIQIDLNFSCVWIELSHIIVNSEPALCCNEVCRNFQDPRVISPSSWLFLLTIKISQWPCEELSGNCVQTLPMWSSNFIERRGLSLIVACQRKGVLIGLWLLAKWWNIALLWAE